MNLSQITTTNNVIISKTDGYPFIEKVSTSKIEIDGVLADVNVPFAFAIDDYGAKTVISLSKEGMRESSPIRAIMVMSGEEEPYMIYIPSWWK